MYKMPKIMSQLDTFNNFIDHFWESYNFSIGDLSSIKQILQ